MMENNNETKVVFLNTKDVMALLKISKTKTLRLFTTYGANFGAFKLNGEWRVNLDDLLRFISKIQKQPDRNLVFN